MRYLSIILALLITLSGPAHAFNWVSGGGGRDPKSARVLSQSGAAVSVTGTVAETALASYTLKGGTMGRNCSLRITTLWSTTNSANNKTLRVKLGGTAFMSPTLTTAASANAVSILRNKNNVGSQVFFTPGSVMFTSSSSAVSTASINTAADQLIEITGQLANTGETITLEGYTIEILPGS